MTIFPQILTEEKRSQETFYPTPAALADKMLEGIDWKAQNVLEPSAGKGDLAKVCAEKIKEQNRGYWRDNDKTYFDRVDCIEVDPNLRAILKDKGFRVVHDDFLTFDTFKCYDLIVMNPPFNKGAEHLMKAISLAEKTGAQIVCLLNAETIRNPYSYTRQKLLEAIEAHGGTVEDCGKAFLSAERKTGVEAVIVRLNIPAPARESTILDEMRRDEKARKASEPVSPYSALIKGNYLEALVDRYYAELDCGIKLMHEYEAMRPFLEASLNDEGESRGCIIGMHIGSLAGKSAETVSENRYIQEVRRKYWAALFRQREFVERLTSNLQREFFKMLETLVDYDFSYYNIYTLAQQMMMQVNTGIEETVMNLFDSWTRKWHYDENSKNRHYFDGWMTNDAFAVNKRVIIPFYGAFDSWDGNFRSYNVESKILDIEKVFDFLSGAVTDSRETVKALEEAHGKNEAKNIQLKYFKITFYKKGTGHITFTDEDVLHKFNLFAARGKNWLPPCYGKKHYKDMTAEEKRVIDSFEGEKSYENVMLRSDYFLNTAQTLMLGAG